MARGVTSTLCDKLCPRCCIAAVLLLQYGAGGLAGMAGMGGMGGMGMGMGEEAGDDEDDGECRF